MKTNLIDLHGNFMICEFILKLLILKKHNIIEYLIN